MTLVIPGFKTETAGGRGKVARKFPAYPEELTEENGSSQTVSIWFTYHVHDIYVKSTARDKGDTARTNQSLS